MNIVQNKNQSNIEELKEKFRNMSKKELGKSITEGEKRMRKLQEKIDHIEEKMLFVKKQIEKIKTKAQAELSESLIQEKQEVTTYEEQDKQVIEKREKRIGDVYIISQKIWKAAHMDPDSDRDTNIFWGEIQELIAKVEESENSKELEILYEDLGRVNRKFRKKYPYILPTEEALQTIEEKSKQLLKQIEKLLSNSRKKKYLKLDHEDMYTREDILKDIARKLNY